MKAFILFTAIVGLFTVSIAQSETTCASRVGSCNYYLCRESIQSCGSEGYFIRFGYHYCSAFEENVRPTSDRSEAQWLDRVASCLQRHVEQIPLATSCSDTEDNAIASHVDCYVSNGYCDQSLELKAKIAETIFTELADPRIFAVMLQILASCATN